VGGILALAREEPAISRSAEATGSRDALHHLAELITERLLNSELAKPASDPRREIARARLLPFTHRGQYKRWIARDGARVQSGNGEAAAKLGHKHQQWFDRVLVLRKEDTRNNPRPPVDGSRQVG